MRLPRVVKFGSIFLLCALGMLSVYAFCILDWHARPFCHSQIMTALRIWMADRNTRSFPNVAGHSHESMLSICTEMGGYCDWVDGYRYVAGLNDDDPGDLVLLYVAEPTRWTWHGDPPSRFRDKAWILVPVDFTFGPREVPRQGQGEESERVSAEQFGRRLRRTLEFLRAHQRPHWETVVAEHQALLERVDFSPAGIQPLGEPNKSLK